MKQFTSRQFLKTSAAGSRRCSARCKHRFSARRDAESSSSAAAGAARRRQNIFALTDPSIEVTLLEPNKEFISCPFSNLVLAGVESLKNLTMNYNGLRKHGVSIRHEAATAIEPDRKRVRVGKTLSITIGLIVSPGSIFSGN